MAFILAIGATYDLGISAPDNYGVFSDTVLVTGGNNDIYTYEGSDTVYTTRLPPLLFTSANLGFGNDFFYGGVSEDSVVGGTGNDYCSLGDGDDRASLCAGNDTLIGGSGTDTIEFFWLYSDVNAGTFYNSTGSVTLDLAKTTAQNLGIFGTDTITGFEDVQCGGGNDRIYGSSVANFIRGDNGNDILDGRAGNDNLVGSDGADWIIGGLGKDILDAGFEFPAAQDRFRFLSIADSSANPALADTIINFDKGGLATDDRIDLSAIDARPLLAGNQAFVFRGTGAFTAAAGEVRLVVAGADTLVHIDTDTDAASEMVIKVTGVTGLKAADFIL